MKKLIAIDGNALLFRAYHATSFDNMMHTSDGLYTNALYAFINMINKIKNDYEYDYLIVAFDAGRLTFRHEQFVEYKGKRSETPEELKMQFPLVREYLNLVKIPNYEVEGFEADDIIGTLANQALKDDFQMQIISSDKDLLQLINSNVNVLLPVKGLSQTKLISEDTMDQIWDITPKQVIDLKGLMGDPSDNIPGVKGVGEKTALKLLHEYGSIENIYQNIDQIKGKLQEKLINDQEIAFQSKDLATIITDINLPFKYDELIEGEDIDYAKLKDFYHRCEFKSFLSNINEQITQDEKYDFTYEEVEKIDTKLLDEELYIDLISLNDNYHKDTILGIVIISQNHNYFMNLKNLYQDQKLLEYLKNKPKITYDLKKNIVIGHWHDLEIHNFTNDLMIQSYVIDSNLKLEANVLVDTNFNVSTLSDKDLLKVSREEQIETKVKQAFYLNKLCQKQLTNIRDNARLELYQLEIEIAHILADMEIKGILVQPDILNNLEKEYQKICDDLEFKIQSYAQEEFNVNSTKQLAEILFEKLNLRVIKKTKTGYSTDNDVLSALYDDHPIIPLIIEYRTYKKMLSTYITPIPDYILKDHRIHTIYNQCLTTTGRLSSRDPNLQNIATRSDVQREVKKIFIAKDGYSLVSLDYSQIELRVLASFSHDPIFIQAFKEGKDIHKATAAKAANISEEEVTSAQRAAAKAINFGIVYGISDFGLAKQLMIDRNEAKTFIDNYYLTYPSIKEYLEGLVTFGQEHGYVTTILNRIRYIKELSSNNHNIKEMGKRMAMNTPIQGSAADILKLAMAKINNEIKNEDVQLLLQVHDELIFEIKDDLLDEYVPKIKNIMEKAYQLEVGLVVESTVGKNWYELK